MGVIGGGIFGVTSAMELAQAGMTVTLYERLEELLAGTTSRNFFRVHRGYHYPRHIATAEAARHGYDSFVETFSAALAKPVTHHYAIASRGSRISVEQFVQHCRAVGLRADPEHMPGVVPGALGACFAVDEAYYVPAQLRCIAWELLGGAGVRIELGSSRPPRDIAIDHDFVVVAAYGSLNEVLVELDCTPVELTYQLCEVPILRTPSLRPTSLVVMDGPFVSLAPHGEGCHALYDVVNSVHESKPGFHHPGFQGYPRDLVPVAEMPPRLTGVGLMLESARRFVRPLADAVHVASYFAERVVMTGTEATDARPTLVAWASPTVLTILSGKVSTAVDAARLVARNIASR